jgi:tetratricopeptide (TPR) repeat protein
LEGVDQQYLSLAYPLRYGSTLNFNFTRLGMSSFDSYDAQGTRTGAVDAGDYALGLAYGRTIWQNLRDQPLLSAGLNLKGIHERLASVTAHTFAADIGLLSFWRPAKLGEFRMGFAAQNLGPGLKFDRVTADLPTAYRIGLAWQGKPKGDTLTVSLDQVLSQEEGHYLAAGTEYTVWRILAFRLGYRMGQDIGLGFRGGVGFKLKALEISYAYAGFGDLGIMHRMGISIRMGGPIETTPPEEQALGTVMEKAKRLMKERRYYEAILEYDKALELDPGNKMALEGMRRAHGMLEIQK